MKRWWKSDAGSWLMTGWLSSQLFTFIAHGGLYASKWGAAWAIAVLVVLLMQLGLAVDGTRRPWLRHYDVVEAPDGSLTIAGRYRGGQVDGVSGAGGSMRRSASSMSWLSRD